MALPTQPVQPAVPQSTQGLRARTQGSSRGSASIQPAPTAPAPRGSWAVPWHSPATPAVLPQPRYPSSSSPGPFPAAPGRGGSRHPPPPPAGHSLPRPAPPPEMAARRRRWRAAPEEDGEEEEEEKKEEGSEQVRARRGRGGRPVPW